MSAKNQTETIKIPGTKIYKLTTKGFVVDDTGNFLPIINNKVTLPLYGRLYTVDIEWLKKYTKYQLYLPNMFQHKVLDIDFKPYFFYSHGLKLDDMVIHKKPMSIVVENTEYRLVPLYPFLAVSESGVIINLTKKDKETHKYRKVRAKNDSSYPNLVIRLPEFIETDVVRKSIAIHRLVAMAWVPNDDYIKKPIVDHKDSNKYNYHASNLEWVSFKENNKRAIITGCRNDNIDVKVMDYEKNKIYIFSSMTQACEFIGRSRINNIEEFCKVPKLINNRYQIKLATDDSDWDFRNVTGNYTITLDGKSENFYTIKDILNKHFPGSTLQPNQSVLKDMLIRKYGDKIQIDFPEMKTLNDESYQVFDIKANRIIDCKTRKDIEKVTGWSKSSVAKYLKLGPDYSFKDFSVRVMSNEEWPEIKHNISDRNISLTVKKLSTGEVKNCRSLREASGIIGIDKKIIKQALISGKSIRGYEVYNS